MADLTIFNSLSEKKEVFSSRKKISIYVCGVTPYDITHLGHAFTYVSFDMIIRYLRYLKNVRDIDDDIIKKAKETGIEWRLLGEKNFSLFLDDLQWLNIRQPDFFPRASDHIPEIISLIRTLLKKGFAYKKNRTVYFDRKNLFLEESG